VAFLQGRSDIDPSRIGLCGHCLGAILAARAAENIATLRFLVLLTPPGTNGDEQWLAYRRLSESRPGRPAGAVDSNVALDERFIAAVLAGDDVAPVQREMRSATEKEFRRRQGSDLKELAGFEDYFNSSDWAGLLSFGPTTFGRNYFAYDPKPSFRAVTTPTLVLLGGADTSIPSELHRPLLEEAFSRSGPSPAEIRIIPAATHYFTRELSLTGMTFVPEFLPAVTEWISRQTRTDGTSPPVTR
jgi:pimeloyl-ACP methyl ester carboxylesterase